MKKLGKVLAFTLIFALVITLFAGLDLYQDDAIPVIAGGNGQGYQIIVITNKINSVNTANLCTGIDSILDDEIKTPTGVKSYATTYSVAEFEDNPDSKVKNADLIVIDMNQTGTQPSWNAVMAIFNKIVGKSGQSAKFMISSDTYGSESSLEMNTSTAETVEFFYKYANVGYKFTKGANSQNDNTFDVKYSLKLNGCTKNTSKLFLMLNTFSNPGIFNSIFLNGSSEFGIVVDDGVAYYKGLGSADTSADGAKYISGEGAIAEGKLYEAWNVKMFKPYHILKNNYDWDEGDLVSTLGYTNSFSFNASSYNQGEKSSFRVNEAGLVFAPIGKGVDFSSNEFKNAFRKTYGFTDKSNGSIKDEHIKKENCDSNSFRMLVVQANISLGDNRGNKVDESAAYQVIKAYRSSSKTIGGGVTVDYMSIYEFNSTDKDISASYDVIYFGAEKDYLSYGYNDSYKGQKLSQKMYNELVSFKSNGGKIIYSTELKNLGTNAGLLNNITPNYTDNNNDFSSVVATVVNDVMSSKTTLQLFETPALYYAQDNFVTTNENAAYDYYYYKQKNPGNSDYINGDGSGSRALNFEIKVDGNASSYKLKLYLDLNTDGVFDDRKTINGDENKNYECYKTYPGSGEDSLEPGKIYSFSWDVVPKGYVGALPWRLDLCDASGNKILDSKSGMSALRPKSSEKIKINLLQIVVDTEWGTASNELYSADDEGYLSNTFYIPTDAEYALAKSYNGDKDIDMTNYSGKNKDSLSSINTYFDNALTITIIGDKNQSFTNLKSKYKDAKELAEADKYIYKLVKSSELNSKKGDTSNGGTQDDLRKSIIYNAGLFTYFLKSLKNYDISTSRFSLYELADEWDKWKEDEIAKKYKDKSFTEKLTMWTDAWTNDLEKAKEKESRVLYDSTNGIIYYVNSLYKVTKCDMLVTGFCDSMVRKVEKNGSGEKFTEIVNENTVNMIGGYLDHDGYALVGRGLLNADKNEALSRRVRGPLGMTENYAWGYNKTGNGMNAQQSKVNDGALTKFPYDVPKVFNASNTCPPIYTLNVEDSSIVGYFTGAMITRGGSDDAAEGNTESNYRMYRKGNITYVNAGFNMGNLTGQKAITFKLPEAVLLVNVVVNSVATPEGGDEVPPKFTPENPGVNEYPKKKPVPNPKGGSPIQVDCDQDYFFIDYETSTDENGEAKPSSNAMKDDPYVPIKEEDGKILTYQRVIFTITDGDCDPKFTVAGTEIPASKMPVYLIDVDYEAEEEPFDALGILKDDRAKLLSEATDDQGHLKTGKTYYVDIPVYSDFYKTDLNLTGDYGLDKNETLSIGVELIPTDSSKPRGYEDIVIGKRGMFTIN